MAMRKAESKVVFLYTMSTYEPFRLTVFSFPIEHRRMVRTINALEQVNRELRRRTRVFSIFPNEASCLWLILAILMEICEEWQVGKRYCTDQDNEI